MIKSLTPYKISIPFVSPLTGLTCTAFTLRLYVWNGLKGSPPATPTYEITKTNPTASTENDKINITRLVNDFIDFTAVTGTITDLLDGDNQQWVKWDTLYETTNPLDATTPSNTNTQLMLQGYGYGLEGENPQPPTNKILIPLIDYKVNRNGYFNVPILIEETPVVLGTLEITDITLDSGDQYDVTFTQSGNLDTIYYRYKLSSDVVWTLGFESTSTSPFTITLPTIAGTYNVQLFAYDNDNAIDIYSNIFNVVIV